MHGEVRGEGFVALITCWRFISRCVILFGDGFCGGERDGEEFIVEGHVGDIGRPSLNDHILRMPSVDVVFDGAFGGVRDEEVVVGEGVVVISSSLDMLTNNCLGGIMVSLIFLEGLDEEALVEFMIPKGVCQNAEIIAVPRWDSGQLHKNSEGHSRRIRDL
ncbi:hypothetical protein Tco_0336228 [Tanacetum coccineum]